MQFRGRLWKIHRECSNVTAVVAVKLLQSRHRGRPPRDRVAALLLLAVLLVALRSLRETPRVNGDGEEGVEFIVGKIQFFD